MEEKDSEQPIDQQPSESSIDQITKVPISKPKVKNPKRVAAGKKLSQYNKKARQNRDAVMKEEQNLIQEKQDDDGNDQWLPKTSFTSIIALLGLGLTALDLFLRYKTQRFNEKIDSINNFKFADSVESQQDHYDSAVPQRVEISESSKSFGGME